MRKLLMALLLLNVAAVDYGAYRADKALRAVRDEWCGSRNSYRVSTYDFVMVSSEAQETHLYGCSSDGHRYRLWVRPRPRLELDIPGGGR